MNFTNTGLNLRQLEDFSIQLEQNSYIDGIEPVSISKQQSRMRNENLNPDELKRFRSLIGQLSWIAGQTGPDIAFDTYELSSCAKNATVQDLLRANKVLLTTKLESVVITVRNMGDLDTVKLVSFNDSSLAILMKENYNEAMLFLWQMIIVIAHLSCGSQRNCKEW